MTCSNCGTDNPEGARFCGGCGRLLPDAASAAPPEPVPPVPPAPPEPQLTQPISPIEPIEPIAPIGSSDPTLAEGVPTVPPAPPAPPDATAGFPTPPPGPEPVPATAAVATKKSKKGLVLGVLALLVVGAVVASFFVLGGDDDEEIVLEPIGVTLRDDFAGNLDEEPSEDSVEIALPEVPELDETEEDDDEPVVAPLASDGDEPGLYGGSRDTEVCDISALIDFLTDDRNADKAEAWARVQGIEVDEIEDFIDDLTPVRLRFDTRVTNHGFSDGRANPFQSVLEAGTAVLVDDTGAPRVKCNCGNPLAEPTYIDDDRTQNPDAAWDDYDPDLVMVVNIDIGDQIDDFILIDLETGELFARPAGTDGDDDGDVDPDAVCDDFVDSPTCNAPPDDDDDDDDDDETTTTSAPDDPTTSTSIVLGTGDVQVTLRWGSNADLDLVVVDPTGEQASRSSTTSTGGDLDVDSNIGCLDDGSVENVFWPVGAAPAGEYTVVVEGYGVAPDGACGSGDYQVTVTTAGQAPQTFTGTVGDGAESTHTFQVG